MLTLWNHNLKKHGNTCIVCGKMCQSNLGLKRHLKIHKNDLPLEHLLNAVRNSSHVCYICLKSCKSAAGIKSHSKDQEQALIVDQDTWIIILVIKTAIIWQGIAAAVEYIYIYIYILTDQRTEVKESERVFLGPFSKKDNYLWSPYNSFDFRNIWKSSGTKLWVYRRCAISVNIKNWMVVVLFLIYHLCQSDISHNLFLLHTLHTVLIWRHFIIVSEINK